MNPKFVITDTMLPARSFRVTIADNGQDQFVAQLKNFSAANHLDWRFAQIRPDTRYITVDMKRGDINVTVDNPFSSSDFYISFYKSDFKAPPVPENTLDTIEQSLKNFVPGITVDPEK